MSDNTSRKSTTAWYFLYVTSNWNFHVVNYLRFMHNGCYSYISKSLTRTPTTHSLSLYLSLSLSLSLFNSMISPFMSCSHSTTTMPCFPSIVWSFYCLDLSFWYYLRDFYVYAFQIFPLWEILSWGQTALSNWYQNRHKPFFIWRN